MVEEVERLHEELETIIKTTSFGNNSASGEVTEKGEVSDTKEPLSPSCNSDNSSSPEVLFVSMEMPAVSAVHPRKPEKRQRDEDTTSDRLIDHPIVIIDSSASSSDSSDVLES